MAFPNNYAGRCDSCGSHVPAKAGTAFKKGGWRVCCASEACGRKCGLAPTAGAAVVDTARTLRQDGDLLVVRTPKDGNALPLLRALPGARWNPERVAWTCSAKPADLPRVLELADRLALDVPAELRARAAIGTVDEQAAAGRADTAGLYPFQRDGVRFLARRDRALLADDMGCGKTVEALCALPDGGRALVVCPNVVKHNWANEAARWRPDLRVTVLSGRGSFREPGPGEIVVINYDLLPKAPKRLKKGDPCTIHDGDCKTNPEMNRACADEQRKSPPKLPYDLAGVVLVVDEAHLVKNHKAARTQAVEALSRQCAKAWLLTGTPLANRALDLWGVLGAGGMAFEVFGGWKGFTRCFNAFQNRWGGYEFGEPLPEVPERLRRVMLRRTKAEVLPDLPAVTYQQLPCNGIDASLRRDLDRAWDEYGDELQGGSLPDFEEFSALRARLAASRIPALTELVEQYEETGTPVLVFSAHRAPVDTIAQREGWAAITGDTPAEERTAVVARFQAGELKGVALTIAAGGVGITLTHASTAIFVDLAWRPADNWQAEDRMRRIGQTADKITVVRLVSDHPLDLHVQNLLVAKIALIQAAVEKTAAYTAPAAQPSATWRAETDEQLAARLAQRAADVEAAEREVERAEAKSKIARKLANGGGVRKPVELTPEQAQAVRGAFGRLCDDCDGAMEQDGAGFNKPDQGIKNWLLAVGLDDPEALELAYHLVRSYPKQVKDAYPELWA
jgi:SNF2 domain-containing protein/helicase-like protein